MPDQLVPVTMKNEDKLIKACTYMYACSCKSDKALVGSVMC